MSADIKSKWNQVYTRRESSGEVATVLLDHTHLLPESGKALDVACGLGANALFLADKGLDVDAWDISDVAIDKLNAQKGDLSISAKAIDITPDVFPKDHYDVILNAHFLDRALIPAMIKALTPGGMVFFQTFTKEKTVDFGPSNPNFLLDPGELLTLFRSLSVLAHEDHGATNIEDDPLSGQAYIVARRDT